MTISIHLPLVQLPKYTQISTKIEILSFVINLKNKLSKDEGMPFWSTMEYLEHLRPSENTESMNSFSN